ECGVKQIEIPIIDDSEVEEDETVVIMLSNPSGAKLNEQNRAVLTLIDNDKLTISFTQETYRVEENAESAPILFALKGCGPLTEPFSVSYASREGGTATVWKDYERVRGKLSWEANDCGSKSFEVRITDDRRAENQETVFLRLTEATGGAKGIQSEARLTIIDNDSSTLGFSQDNYLVHEGEQSVSITVERTDCNNYYTLPAASVWYLVYEGEQLAASKEDFQPLRGQLSWETDQCLPLTFEVPIVDDSEVEGDETLTLELTALSGATWGKKQAVLTIIDNEPLENQIGTPGRRPMTVKMALNQNFYFKDASLRLDITVDGRGEADLYLAIRAPNGEIVTLGYPDKWSSQLATHQPYFSKLKIAGKQVYPILNKPIPAGLALGTYTLCGLLLDPNAVDVLNQANWIYWDCPTLKIYEFSPFRDTLQDGSLGPEMIMIPAGTFRMGDIQGGARDEEKPVHEVSVARFAIGRYEVTNAEFVHFLNTIKHRGPELFFDTKAENFDSHIMGSTGNFTVEAGYENHPVIKVSWYGATAYLNWLTEQTGRVYRLPTEAEWEYAARAGTETKYWWGNDFGTNRANCGYGWSSETTPVGSFEANPFGLYDTVGNIKEWCADPWHSNYENAPTDGRIWKKPGENRRLLRGGAFFDFPYNCRAASRFMYASDYHYRSRGFRGCADLAL
ncbi:MAG: SUMF1/EgtB/PvdO family nonheme iron enzyme, partial [Candidatus Parabeggiatoa sp.]|nr:SUMF1/EgtB/PvdO family nonheme iron enzyme [Candidatus Parabeggiatoa sp.]